MKKITTTILILFVCFCGYGQKDSSFKTLFIRGGVITNDTSFYTSATSLTTTGYLPKQDTIRVLMLVCDTSSEMPNGSGIHFFIDWQYGYKVIEIVPQNWEVGDVQVQATWQTIQYLDADKKPLPKSTIVWLTKEIK